MRVGLAADFGRLPRASILASMKGGSTPYDTPGLAIPSIIRGFTPDGHRDSSLYRGPSLPQYA